MFFLFRRIAMKNLLRVCICLAVISACSPSLVGQNPQLRTRNGGRFPTVVFTSVLWNANPPFYSIAIDSTGASTYQSAPDSTDATGVPYTITFQANDSTRRTAFNVIQTLDFLRGDFAVSQGSPATMPVHTLAYHDLTFNNQIIYSATTDSEIQELTSIFQEVSATLEFGRRLDYLRRTDKGKLDGELSAMLKDAERHTLRELQTVAPVLRSIVSDSSIGGHARREAEDILDLSPKNQSGGSPVLSPRSRQTTGESNGSSR